MNAVSRRRAVRREERYDPTPQTLAKLESDVLQDLLARRAITADEERAAREICDIHRAVKRGLFRTQNIGAGHGTADASDAMSEHEARIHFQRYVPWSREEARHLAFRWPTRVMRLGLALKICEQNESIASIGKRHDTNDNRVLQIFRHALNGYVALMRVHS